MNSMKLEGAWMRPNAANGAKPASEPTNAVPTAAAKGSGSQQYIELCWSPPRIIDMREQYPLFPELVIRS